MATAKKLPSGNYRIRVYDKDTGKYKSFTAETKRKAERLANEYLNKPSETELTLSEGIDGYISLKKNVLSPTTINKYANIKKNQLSNDFLHIPMKNITNLDIQAEINRLSAEYSPKTVINANGLVSAVMKTYRPEYAYKITLPKSPKKRKEYPTAEQVMQWFKGEEIELLVLLGLWFGFRMSEIRGLKKSDFKDGKLTINRVKVTVGTETIVKDIAKTVESNRTMQVPDRIQRKIEALQGGYITQLDNRGIYQRFKRVVKKHGYPDITFHDLRHINASVMLMLNIPDKYAMERGGWSTSSTLKRVYQDTFSEERRRVDKKIDDFFGDIYDTVYDSKKNKKASSPRKFKLRKL